MNTALTQSQIDQYQRDGHLIVKNLLTPEELDRVRNAVAESVESLGSKHIAGKGNEELFDDDEYQYDSIFLQRLNLWKINDTLKDTVANPDLGKMLCDLEGIDGIRIWHDQTLQKAPWANPTVWHLDNPYWSFHSRHAISMWIALDDVTVQNGCLYYLSGTHKMARFDNVPIGNDVADLFKVYPEFKTIVPAVAEMKAGDAGFHNGITAHAAGPNMTPHWRRAMTCAYMPEGSTFNGNQNILSKTQFEKYQVGDVMADDEQNPVVYRRG